VHTVQTHIKHLYGKLAVHSKNEAVFEAMRLGLLHHPGPS
jgi:DNA-binding CsgD family transcriptional regulator